VHEHYFGSMPGSSNCGTHPGQTPSDYTKIRLVIHPFHKIPSAFLLISKY